MINNAPPGWRIMTLEGLQREDAGICYGVVQPGDESPGAQRLIRVCDLVDGVVAEDSLRTISSEVDAEYARSRVAEGDVLVSVVGTIGRVALVHESVAGANIARAVARLRPGPAALPRWYQIVLNAPSTQDVLLRESREVARKTLNVSTLASIPVPVPPLKEQKRIVGKLDVLQAHSRRAREALDAVPPLLEKLRRSILGAAFRGSLTANWRADHSDIEPAKALLERIRIERRRQWEQSELARLEAKGKRPADDKWKAKYQEPSPVVDADLPELPTGWCWASVDELCPGDAPAVYGIILPGDDVPNGVPYIRPIDMRDDGTVEPASIKRTTREIADQYARASLQTGDVVLSIVGTIGKVVIVPEELAGANITQSSARIRPPKSMSSQYMSLALRSPILVRQFDAVRFGNAVQRLNVEHVRQLAIPLAPELEQSEISKRAMQSLDSLPEATLEALREQLTLLDGAMLNRALRGELVPQSPDEADVTLMQTRNTTETNSAPQKARTTVADATPHKGRRTPARRSVAGH